MKVSLCLAALCLLAGCDAYREGFLGAAPARDAGVRSPDAAPDAADDDDDDDDDDDIGDNDVDDENR